MALSEKQQLVIAKRMGSAIMRLRKDLESKLSRLAKADDLLGLTVAANPGEAKRYINAAAKILGARGIGVPVKRAGKKRKAKRKSKRAAARSRSARKGVDTRNRNEINRTLKKISGGALR